MLLLDGPLTVSQLAGKLSVAPTTVSLIKSQRVLVRHGPAISKWLAPGARAWRHALTPLTPPQRRMFADAELVRAPTVRRQGVANPATRVVRPESGCSKCVAAPQASGKVAKVVIAEHEHPVRQATAFDADVVAELLDAFNHEFDTPSPGTKVLAARLRRLIAGNHLVALLSDEPAVGVAVLSFRANAWYDGPVAALDELYVRPHMRGQRFGHAMLEGACRLARERGAQMIEINVDGEDTDARRFYEAHGFANIEPGATEPMFYYYRDLA